MASIRNLAATAIAAMALLIPAAVAQSSTGDPGKAPVPSAHPSFIVTVTGQGRPILMIPGRLPPSGQTAPRPSCPLTLSRDRSRLFAEPVPAPPRTLLRESPAMKPTFAAAVLLSFGALASAQTPRQYIQHRQFPSGGTVVVTLNVGDLRIVPADGSAGVRLEIQTHRPVDQEAMAGWVRRFEIAADRAVIDIHIPKWNDNCADDCGGDVTLYVPPQTSLKADLGVGDMTIRGVQGDKEVHTGVGDLRIAVADPSEYGHVETHTRIGDVNDILNRGDGQSGFLGKTENFTLSGRYHLKASTGIGDLRIFAAGKS